MKFDIDPLLQPITPGAAGGEDLSFSAQFDAIQEARREEDASLDQGDWVREVKEADWNRVIELAGNLLRERSKDLRLAGWLAEAMGRTGGFAGLAQGLALVEQLVVRFWPQLHPLPDGEDQEERIGALAWLIQRSAALLQGVAVAQAPAGQYCWADYESARALQNRIERSPDDAEAISRGHLTLAEFRSAAATTPKTFYEKLHADFADLREAAGRFERAVDSRLGAQGPGFLTLRETIDSVGELVERLASESGALAAKPAATGETDAAEASADDVATSAQGPIRSRAQALRQLRQVAEFFRRTEPHSPVAYLADKAAAWGDMPLHQWLKQVVKDGGALAHLEELLGLEANKQD